MEIGRKFNTLSVSEYKHYIENYKKYVDFNTLGLYRSILENEKLTVEDKIFVKDFANTFFKKTFDFLQLKDPFTYFQLTTLDKTLTVSDERQLWNQIKINQEKILKDKKIRHRNFGVYSKHSCSYETCGMNGLMIEQGSFFTEHIMRFISDKNKFAAQLKSERFKKERKNEKQIVKTILDFETEKYGDDE